MSSDIEALRHYFRAPLEERPILREALPDTPTTDPETLIREALPTQWENRDTGRFLEQHFERTDLRGRYPNELLNILVPNAYTPSKPMGLLILLHGGGKGTPRTAGANWLLQSNETEAYHFGDVLQTLPFITFAPGNLLLETYKRWSTPESDAYILAVIEEASFRYNVDPNRVVIAGQSMGGFGAYHVAQTIGDRFARIGCHAGAWAYGFWEGLHGVDLHIMHGEADAATGVRPRFTDVAFARFAHAALSGFHIPHAYVEHKGGHSFSDPAARKAFTRFLTGLDHATRDPFPQKIVAGSSKGAFRLQTCPHHFWITIHPQHYDTMFGTFELDHIDLSEPQPSFCTTHFRHRTIRTPGSVVWAENLGGNAFNIQTRNVYDMTLWLSEHMVDFSRPVSVTINGECRHKTRVRTSLKTAIESFARRHDPGMICPAKIAFNLKIDDHQRIKA